MREFFKNILQPCRTHITKRHMRIACLLTKATDIHQKYVIRIAFTRQQLLRERASILRTSSVFLRCLVCAYQTRIRSTVYLTAYGLSCWFVITDINPLNTELNPICQLYK